MKRVKREVFPHAPIAEALLDLRVSGIAGSVDERFEGFGRKISLEFPTKKPRLKVGAAMVPTTSADSARLPISGFVHINPNETRIVQARLDGFSISHLKPYNNWENLREDSKRLWKQYRNTFNPIAVDRQALRYINRIMLPLPLPKSGFEAFIKTGVKLSDGMPQGLSEMFLRVVVPHENAEKNQVFAVITMTLEPVIDGTLPLIFDIDVFSNKKLKPGAAEIWKTFEVLHDFKNRIFFGSITDRARKLFR